MPAMPEAIDLGGRDYRYDQLAAIIRRRIWSGELAPGRPVPSKKTLLQEYDISTRTVDTAMGILKEEGLIETRIGKGLYVLPRERWRRLPGQG